MRGGSCWKQDLLGTDEGQMETLGEPEVAPPNLAVESRRASEVGYLNLSPRRVIAEQVACGRNFRRSPREQGRARSHFLGLQVLGGL